MGPCDDVNPLVVRDMRLWDVLQGVVNGAQHLDDFIATEFLGLVTPVFPKEAAIPIDIVPAEPSLRRFECVHRHCLEVGCPSRRACVENRPDLLECWCRVFFFNAFLTLLGGHRPQVFRVAVLRHVAQRLDRGDGFVGRVIA